MSIMLFIPTPIHCSVDVFVCLIQCTVVRTHLDGDVSFMRLLMEDGNFDSGITGQWSAGPQLKQNFFLLVIQENQIVLLEVLK